MRRLVLSASVLALACGTPAYAQDQTPAEVPATSDAELEQGQVDRALPADGDIIVTGERFGRTLRETQSSVVIYTGRELEDRSVRDLYDAVLRTPNVQSSNGDKGFAIRGIDQRLGAGAGLLITTVVDGASLPNNQATFFGPYSAWDVEQIEILRGPQGTTQGRNALGGAIIINTADPRLGKWEVKARGSYAELDSYQVAGALNVPIGSTLAARVAVDRRESDGWVFNPTRNELFDRRELLNARGKLLWAPTDRLRAQYTFNYTENFGGEDLVSYARSPAERVNLSNDPGREGSEHRINTLEVNADLSDALSLTSVSTYYLHDYLRQEDFDGTPASLGSIDRTQDDENFQQELRLNFNGGGPVRAVLGGFYGRFRSDVVDLVRVPTAFVDRRLPAGVITQARDLRNDEENVAAFGEVELDVLPRLTLVAGARYDRETRDFSGLSATSVVTQDPRFQAAVAAQIARLAPDVRQATDATFDAFLPKAGVRYRFGGDVMLGFTAQRAYRAGGASVSTVTQTLSQFDPEYAWTYEASLRATTPDRRFSLAANVFYTDWTDQIVNQLIDPAFPQDFIAVNAGKSRLYGAELTLEARPSRTLTVFGGLGLLDTRFTDFVTENEEFTGNRFSYAPPVSVNAGFDYRHPTGLRALGDVKLTAAYFSDTINDPARTVVTAGREVCAARPCNSPAVRVPSFVVANLRVGYEAERFALFAFARNLFDEDYVTQVQPNGQARSAEPRVAGVEATVRF